MPLVVTLTRWGAAYKRKQVHISNLKNMCSAHIPRHIHYEKLKNMCSAHIFKQGKGFQFYSELCHFGILFRESGAGAPACLAKIPIYWNFITNGISKQSCQVVLDMSISVWNFKNLKFLPVQTPLQNL